MCKCCVDKLTPDAFHYEYQNFIIMPLQLVRVYLMDSKIWILNHDDYDCQYFSSFVVSEGTTPLQAILKECEQV